MKRLSILLLTLLFLFPQVGMAQEIFDSEEPVLEDVVVEEPEGEPELVEDVEEPVIEEVVPEELLFTGNTSGIFRFERQGWNTFVFTALVPTEPNYRFAWDFGDDVTSSKHDVEHKYSSAGEYTVSLQMTDPDGNVKNDTAVIVVPFFSVQNPIVISVIGVLSLFLFILIVISLRLTVDVRRERKRRM